jgi:hypothetical protein
MKSTLAHGTATSRFPLTSSDGKDVPKAHPANSTHMRMPSEGLNTSDSRTSAER